MKDSSLARLRLTQLSPATAHLTLSINFTKFEPVKEVYPGSVRSGCDSLEQTYLKLDLFLSSDLSDIPCLGRMGASVPLPALEETSGNRNYTSGFPLGAHSLQFRISSHLPHTECV